MPLIAAVLLLLAGCPLRAAERPEVTTLADLGPALLACWHPSGFTGAFVVRLRLSFRRDGAVLGRPQIVYTSFRGETDERRQAGQAIARALAACTPLRFSTSFGAAVAGRLFVVSFVWPWGSA